MTAEPTRYTVGPQFAPGVALVFPGPLDQLAWYEEDHADLVGSDFVENKSQLFVAPGMDPNRWRRAAFPARPPFQQPG
ncbi:MAG: hypothetical protein GY925_29035 [Actinomycetia bacterium]|nr:hypothetical protein [Actinomycetes bacterium]